MSASLAALAAWVARVDMRSSSDAMFASAPSLICSFDMPSFALRMPWFRIAWSLRYLLATARPAESSPDWLRRKPLDNRLIALCMPIWLTCRLDCALSRAEVEVSSVDCETACFCTRSDWRLKSASACFTEACAPDSAACACSSLSL